MTSAANPGHSDGHGDRLRDARQRAGLSVADVASRMRVPARVVESLESGDWGRLGAPVFIRGQVRSYARVLGVPADSLLPPEAQQPLEPSRLHPRTYTSPLQRYAEQAARKVVYVVITAAIAVPVWMVTRQHVDGPGQGVIALDVDPSSMDQGAARADGVVTTEAAPRTPAQQRPLVASMAPPVQRTAPASAVAQSLSLEFRGDSWMQVLAPDGREVEQALVRAGDSRSYEPGQVGRVVLGNAGGVEVRRNGEVQDLAGFKRANVARFEVSSDGSLVPVSE
ncbi:DUF4115 domain-containing protein [Luteimonas yindakuii]|uniref:DUF4115 domain-containing protein n=1 Tax=Luteimonas yindakuii TaxID=2565782 RepID=A0A4Z1R4T8_9GAMM|nr:helix-turn-helix domain-containing protein [Luteimonas yindakuii]TKS53926.1 DUF4115 domain-containing protein [Luteimonas yindakuii]